jgi:large subunit ribosomal protein L3
MPGHMGDERVTTRCMDVVKVETERNLLLVKVPVPGANNGIVWVRGSTRLGRSKQKKLADAAKK